MGTEIAQRSTQYAGEDRRWLDGGFHGQDANKDVTLDGSLFSSGAFPNGRIPSGQVLGIVTATKLAGPYDDTATDGRQVAAGHLLNTETVISTSRVVTAVVRHGVVNENLLPTGHGLDAAAKVDLSRIIYQTL